MIFNMTGGGAPLNFKVVGGTTQPSNPAENTIWVNTSINITGYYFTAAQPSNMANGELWFSVGMSSVAAFNALKKNNVTVYPLSAKQMVSGKLNDVTAKIYRGSAWSLFLADMYLYNAGNEYTSVTGGINTSANKATVTKATSYIQIKGADGVDYVSRYGTAYTAKKIDITNYKTLVGVCETYKKDGHGSIKVCLTTNLSQLTSCNQTNYNAITGTELSGTGAGNKKEVKVDISKMTGEYYIGVYGYNSVENKCHSLKLVV